MNNPSVHSHPVPISRINSVYCESDTSVPHQLGVSPPASLPEASNALLDAAMKSAREYLSRKSIHPAIQIPVKSKRTIGFSELNRSDSTDIKSYSYNLSHTNNCQIASIRKKIELYPDRYNDQIYLSQSQILLLSHGWANAQRYSCCSMRSSINPSGACRLHRYCPYCCYLKARDVQLQFVPVFGDSNWHFLTGSFRGSLDMPDTNSCYDWLQYWDAYKSALTKLTDDKIIRGFYMVEELAVNKILQPSMLPHIHAIIDADELSESTLDEVGKNVAAHLKANSVIELAPDVVAEPIESQRSLMDHIKYMFKPINIVKAYESDWREHCSFDRKRAWQLNSITTDLVVGYSHVNLDRPKMTFKGTLNIRCGDYIGKSVKERDKFKPLLKRIRAESHNSYFETPDVDDSEFDVTLN